MNISKKVSIIYLVLIFTAINVFSYLYSANNIVVTFTNQTGKKVWLRWRGNDYQKNNCPGTAFEIDNGASKAIRKLCNETDLLIRDDKAPDPSNMNDYTSIIKIPENSKEVILKKNASGQFIPEFK